jgi:hypothetical protein
MIIITINQLINAFREFSQEHKFLKDFGYGPTWEIGTTRQMDFPYMWISHTPQSRIEFSNKTTTPILNFYAFMLDQRNDQIGERSENGLRSDNTAELMSDTFQFIQDFITWITLELNQYGVMLNNDPTVIPVYDETQDKSWGWYVDFELKIKFVNCEIPL